MKLKQYFSREHIEGARIPLFYLPVFQPYNMYAYELWIFPLAIFVWFWRILTGLFWNLWIDCQELIRLLHISAKNKEENETKRI